MQQRVLELRDQSARDGEEPILVLLQEIQALILHLKGEDEWIKIVKSVVRKLDVAGKSTKKYIIEA